MRKPYDTGKSGIFALGRLNNIDSYLENLSYITDESIDSHVLDKNVQQAYQEMRECCYYYDAQGNPQIGEFDPSVTCTYAIETGYMTNSATPQMIYASYSRDYYGNWYGVFFTTKIHLYNQLNAYRFGAISFKNFTTANKFIDTLHEELLPGEVWEFKSSAEDNYRIKTGYDILQSYLQYVFEKLLAEYNDPLSRNYQKIILSTDNKYALFNTGLLSKFATDIFVMGEVFQLQSNGHFTLSNLFLAPGKVDLLRYYAFDSSVLTPMPEMVEFFKNIDEIIFDAKIEIDLSPEKLNHTVIDGIKKHRYPDKYIKMYEEGDQARIATMLTNAIDNAKKIAKRNFKYVVPQYRPACKGEVGRIQFLMPIYLDTQYSSQPDFALVLNDERIGKARFYTPETVLELSWAYNNARVICKPDDTWLSPARIEETPADEAINLPLSSKI